MIYIDRLFGNVVDIEKNHVILNVHGVGYIIFVNFETLQKMEINAQVLLYIQQQITEFDTRLFGFLTKKDKEFFVFLHKINGVSSKIAFSILDNWENFVSAVINEEKKELENLPGIGKKIAERLILESRKFVEENYDCNQKSIIKNIENHHNILELKSALKNLGYKIKQINAVVDNLSNEDLQSNIENLIKKSLLMIK